MNKLVTGIMRGMQGDLGDHGINPDVALETKLPVVLGHEGRLQEVLFNLVRNAIDAMRSGSAAARTLQVRTEKRGHDAIGIFVQDSGPGIVPAQIERIFDPFVTTKKNGMGMGLTICRIIIERHGGKLSASSGAGAGARFDITLPVEPADEDQQSDETAMTARSTRAVDSNHISGRKREMKFGCGETGNIPLASAQTERPPTRRSLRNPIKWAAPN